MIRFAYGKEVNWYSFRSRTSFCRNASPLVTIVLRCYLSTAKTAKMSAKASLVVCSSPISKWAMQRVSQFHYATNKTLNGDSKQTKLVFVAAAVALVTLVFSAKSWILNEKQFVRSQHNRTGFQLMRKNCSRRNNYYAAGNAPLSGSAGVFDGRPCDAGIFCSRYHWAMVRVYQPTTYFTLNG